MKSRLLAILVFISLLACSSPAQDVIIIRVAFPSTVDISDVAALIAFDQMVAEGIPVTPTFYAQTELMVAAVAADQADIGVGSSPAWLSAIQKGEAILGFSGQVSNGWSVMARNDLDSCAAIDGKRTAIHSEGSSSTAMLRAYIDSTCPEITPEYLIIPGSENRAAALMAGDIDVTPAELIDAMLIMALRPGEFSRIADFSNDLPDLKTNGFWVSAEFAAEHPKLIEVLVRNLLIVHRQINDDPAWFVEQVKRFIDFDDADQALLPEIVAALIATGQYTIDFFTAAGRIDPGLTAEEAYDLSFLNSVLDEIGRR